MYYYDIDDTDDKWKFYTEKINPLLVWFYKLKKQKIHNNICNACGVEFRFRKKRLERMPGQCSECDPDKFVFKEN